MGMDEVWSPPICRDHVEGIEHRFPSGASRWHPCQATRDKKAGLWTRDLESVANLDSWGRSTKQEPARHLGADHTNIKSRRQRTCLIFDEHARNRIEI